MGRNKGGIEDYFHLHKNLSNIVLSDRDVMFFWTDYFSSENNSINLKLEDINENELGVSNVNLKGKNVLWFGRTDNVDVFGSSDTKIGPATFVPYKNVTSLNPFVNIFNFNISYDKTSNVITLLFWCNMKASWSGTTYDYNEVHEEYIEENSVWQWDIISGNGANDVAKRHLFLTTGSIKKCRIEGGSYVGNKEGWGMIPVFEEPKKVSLSNDYDLMPSYPVYPKIFRATSDESGGLISVRALNSDGTLIGKTHQVFVVPES